MPVGTMGKTCNQRTTVLNLLMSKGWHACWCRGQDLQRKGKLITFADVKGHMPRTSLHRLQKQSEMEGSLDSPGVVMDVTIECQIHLVCEEEVIKGILESK